MQKSEPGTSNFKPAKIVTTNIPERLKINDNQIDLLKFIKEVRNSKNEVVEKSELQVFVDNAECPTKS